MKKTKLLTIMVALLMASSTAGLGACKNLFDEPQSSTSGEQSSLEDSSSDSSTGSSETQTKKYDKVFCGATDTDTLPEGVTITDENGTELKKHEQGYVIEQVEENKTVKFKVATTGDAAKLVVSASEFFTPIKADENGVYSVKVFDAAKINISLLTVEEALYQEGVSSSLLAFKEGEIPELNKDAGKIKGMASSAKLTSVFIQKALAQGNTHLTVKVDAESAESGTTIANVTLVTSGENWMYYWRDLVNGSTYYIDLTLFADETHMSDSLDFQCKDENGQVVNAYVTFSELQLIKDTDLAGSGNNSCIMKEGDAYIVDLGAPAGIPFSKLEQYIDDEGSIKFTATKLTGSGQNFYTAFKNAGGQLENMQYVALNGDEDGVVEGVIVAENVERIRENGLYFNIWGGIGGDGRFSITFETPKAPVYHTVTIDADEYEVTAEGLTAENTLSVKEGKDCTFSVVTPNTVVLKASGATQVGEAVADGDNLVWTYQVTNVSENTMVTVSTVTFYDVSVNTGDWAVSGNLSVAEGEDCTFTVTTAKNVILTASGATQVGDAVVDGDNLVWTYQVSNVTEDAVVTLTAAYSYTVTVDAGDLTVNGTLTVAEGEDCTFTVTTAKNIVLTANGATQVGDAVVDGDNLVWTYKVSTVVENVTVTITATKYYTVTVNAPESAVVSGELTVAEGEDCTFNITTSNDFVIKASGAELQDKVVGATETVWTYVVSDVQQDCTVTVASSELCIVTVQAPASVTINGTFTVEEGEDCTFTATTAKNVILTVTGAAQVGDAVVDGDNLVWTYTISQISQDVEVILSAKSYYTVKVNAPDGMTVSGEFTVEAGAACSFTLSNAPSGAQMVAENAVGSKDENGIWTFTVENVMENITVDIAEKYYYNVYIGNGNTKDVVKVYDVDGNLFGDNGENYYYTLVGKNETVDFTVEFVGCEGWLYTVSDGGLLSATEGVYTSPVVTSERVANIEGPYNVKDFMLGKVSGYDAYRYFHFGAWGTVDKENETIGFTGSSIAITESLAQDAIAQGYTHLSMTVSVTPTDAANTLTSVWVETAGDSKTYQKDFPVISGVAEIRIDLAKFLNQDGTGKTGTIWLNAPGTYIDTSFVLSNIQFHKSTQTAGWEQTAAEKASAYVAYENGALVVDAKGKIAIPYSVLEEYVQGDGTLKFTATKLSGSGRNFYIEIGAVQDDGTIGNGGINKVVDINANGTVTDTISAGDVTAYKNSGYMVLEWNYVGDGAFSMVFHKPAMTDSWLRDTASSVYMNDDGSLVINPDSKVVISKEYLQEYIWSDGSLHFKAEANDSCTRKLFFTNYTYAEGVLTAGSANCKHINFETTPTVEDIIWAADVEAWFNEGICVNKYDGLGSFTLTFIKEN